MRLSSQIHHLRVISRTPYGPTEAGQVIVHRGHAYVAPMEDAGVTILDVRRPSHPSVVTQLPVPEGGHTKKVQVAGDLMVVAHERQPRHRGAAAPGGIAIYDVARPVDPGKSGFRDRRPGRAPLLVRRRAVCTSLGERRGLL